MKNSRTMMKHTHIIIAGILAAFVGACGIGENPHGDESSAAAESLGMMTNTLAAVGNPRCSLDRFAVYHNLPIAMNGGAIVGHFAEECYEMAQSGNRRCDALAVQAGLDPIYEFFIVTDSNGTYCGCKCPSAVEGCNASEDVAETAYDAYGAGSQAIPFRIYNSDQIESIANDSFALNDYYMLCKDIQMGSVYGANHPYFTIGSELHPFTGGFDGNGFKIYGFTYDQDGPHFLNPELNGGIQDVNGILLRNSKNGIGFFGATAGATLRALVLKDANVNVVAQRIGGMAGTVGAGSHVTESSSTGKITAGLGSVVGGFAGIIDQSSVDQSYSMATISGHESIGGFAGMIHHAAQISNSYANSNVTSSGWWSGGFVANLGYDAHISKSYATGAVNGGYYTGGFSGIMHMGAAIDHSYATGSVMAKGTAGGFIGDMRNNSRISYSYAKGSVVGINDIIAGFVGTITDESRIEYSYAQGNATGNNSVAGFVGQVNDTSTIHDCYAKGNALGNEVVGGFAGGFSVFDGSIARTYAAGNVSGIKDIGGYAGRVYVFGAGELKDSFAAQSSITGTTNVGRAVGYLYATSLVPANFHHWSGATCGTAVCNASNSTPHAQLSYFSQYNAPMNPSWNISPTTWVLASPSLPAIPSAGQ